jgi:hypothetical protein
VTEAQLHRSVAEYLALAIQPPALWWHTPNGEVRDKATAAKLKRMGVRAGIPDFLVCWPGEDAGLMVWIELKRPGGRLSDHQQAVIADLTRCGFSGRVCTSVQQVWECLNDWGVPLRARPF